jgi:hypothetical protein
MSARTSTILIISILLLGLGAGHSLADQTALERAEELGLEEGPAVPRPPSSPQARRQPPADTLLIPESTNDCVMAFDPTTGDLIDAAFICDSDHLSTPIHAIASPTRDTILVSDQVEDVVNEYDFSGNWLGIYAPAGGPTTSIVDNMRGLALRPATGNLLITVASGANADNVAEFDGAGSYLGNFIDNSGGQLDSPWSVLFRASDVLVTGGTSDAVHQYGTDGSYLGDLITGIEFPEQIAEAGNGNLLVAGFSVPSAVYEYQSDGTPVASYDVVTGCRGVYELPNGNILVTNGDGVHEITRLNTLVETKISGVSARFIELADNLVPVELQTFSVE